MTPGQQKEYLLIKRIVAFHREPVLGTIVCIMTDRVNPKMWIKEAAESKSERFQSLVVLWFYAKFYFLIQQNEKLLFSGTDKQSTDTRQIHARTQHINAYANTNEFYVVKRQDMWPVDSRWKNEVTDSKLPNKTVLLNLKNAPLFSIQFISEKYQSRTDVFHLSLFSQSTIQMNSKKPWFFATSLHRCVMIAFEYGYSSQAKSLNTANGILERRRIVWV